MKRNLRYACHTYTSLKQNPKHNFAHQHALCLYSTNSIYTFIPKNACSTMRATIARENGCIKDEKDIHWIHQNNQTFSANLRELITADYTFVILRCPYSRLASAYLDKIVSRERAAWNLFNLTKRTIDLESLSFAEFVDLLATPACLNGDDHWRQQSDFLVYDDYDDYFCLEDFSSARSQLNKKIGLDILDARSHTKHGSAHLNIMEDMNYADEPASSIYLMKLQGRCPSTKSLYNESTYSKVTQLYKRDIELYKQLFGPEPLLSI